MSEIVSRGFYRHYKGPVYFVLGVGVLDEHGHGNPDAPTQVVYESMQGVKENRLCLRTAKAFVEPVEWPDGVIRPRFVRVEI